MNTFVPTLSRIDDTSIWKRLAIAYFQSGGDTIALDFSYPAGQQVRLALRDLERLRWLVSAYPHAHLVAYAVSAPYLISGLRQIFESAQLQVCSLVPAHRAKLARNSSAVFLTQAARLRNVIATSTTSHLEELS